MQLFILFFLVVFFAGCAAAAAAIYFFIPGQHVFQYRMDWPFILSRLVRTFILISGMSAIQFVAGLHMRHFIGALALGILCWIAANLLLFEMHSPLAAYFPYAFPITNMFAAYEPCIIRSCCISMSIAGITLIGGYYLFRSGRLLRI